MGPNGLESQDPVFGVLEEREGRRAGGFFSESEQKKISQRELVREPIDQPGFQNSRERPRCLLLPL